MPPGNQWRCDERRRIGAKPEPGAVAEGDEAGVADQDVEAMQAIAKITTSVAVRKRQADRERARTAAPRARRRRSSERRSGPRASRYSNLWMRSPNRPRGRNSSTSTISRYIDASPPAGRRRSVSPRTTPTSSGGGDHAPERAEPADHHDDEGGGEDLGAHRRMDAGDRREQHAGEPGEPDAERRDRRHVGLRARCRARRPCRGSARRRAPRGRTACGSSRNQVAATAATATPSIISR